MEVVDWGLARATGRAFSAGGPSLSARGRPCVRRRPARAGPLCGRSRARADRARRRGRAARSRGRPWRVDRQQRRRLPHGAGAAAGEDGDLPARRDDRRRLPRHRAPDGRRARLPVEQGARAVRGVHRLGHRTPAARGPEHRRRRAPPRRRPARLPALGVPARGDASRPVRRRAVAEPAPHRRDPRLPRALRRQHRRGRTPAAPRPRGGALRRARRGGRLARRRRPDPGAAGRLRPDHRAHEPAGGARRLRHGRGRARHRALGRHDPAAFRPAPRARRAPSTVWPVGCSGSTRR